MRLAPEVDIISVTAAHVAGSMFANVNLRNELGKIALAAMQSGRKALDLPSLLADTLRINNKGQSKLNLEMSASEEAQKGLFDLAFVLVMGLVASALILAGAIMAQGRAQLPPQFGRGVCIGSRDLPGTGRGALAAAQVAGDAARRRAVQVAGDAARRRAVQITGDAARRRTTQVACDVARRRAVQITGDAARRRTTQVACDVARRRRR